MSVLKNIKFLQSFNLGVSTLLFAIASFKLSINKKGLALIYKVYCDKLFDLAIYYVAWTRRSDVLLLQCNVAKRNNPIMEAVPQPYANTFL